jgi:hypothetical protein
VNKIEGKGSNETSNEISRQMRERDEETFGDGGGLRW